MSLVPGRRVPDRLAPTTGDTADPGSAVVEWVLVVPLLLTLAIGVIQIILLAHAASLTRTAATEAARAAAVSAEPGSAARSTVIDVVGGSLASVRIDEVRLSRGREAGLGVVSVDVRAVARMWGWGDVTLTGSGFALAER